MFTSLQIYTLSMADPTDAELMTVEGQREVYRKRAEHYDVSSRVFNLLLMPYDGYRARAVEALDLWPGDTVVELGVGTGANLEGFVDAVGSEGRVIGVDLSPEMLDEAREKVQASGWSNVELVESDARDYAFPEELDAILSTFAITLVPDAQKVIERAIAALSPGGHIAILDFKKPDWPDWAIQAYLPLVRLFGGTLEMTERRPWEAVERACEESKFTELYAGGVFLSVGRKR